MGFVYFITNFDHPPIVKIGLTDKPKKRLEELRRESGLKLCIEKLLEFNTRQEALRAEKSFHLKFKSYHFTGEWFFLEGPLADFVMS